MLVWRLAGVQGTDLNRLGGGYAAALVAGAVLGGYGLGTANLWLSGEPGLGRSILGALAGAIAAVELYKARRRVTGSTGAVFVIGFATTVAVGRIGCFLSGLDDFTYGTATALPWGHDFGDGIRRHPVQLYESLAMAGFLAVAWFGFFRRRVSFLRHGFYLLAGFYAAQRFVWEFFKPYGQIVGPLNLFHLVCLGIIVYAGAMLIRQRNV